MHTPTRKWQTPWRTDENGIARPLIPAWSRPHDRRSFLKLGLATTGLLATSMLQSCDSSPNNTVTATNKKPGALNPINTLKLDKTTGILIPDGFSIKAIATANQVVGNTHFAWHTDPDGGAIFPTDDGFIYVSNREFSAGGANAIAFDTQGNILDAYPILTGTRLNCAGGSTPWGTWISCEEHDSGYCWETDPYNKCSIAVTGKQLNALGKFKHEAIAVDPGSNIIYLTEDQPDGLFYRFVSNTPNIGGKPDIANGKLQAMRVNADQQYFSRKRRGSVDSGPFKVTWHDIPTPEPTFGNQDKQSKRDTPTRAQLPGQSTAFDGGEGMAYQDGVIYFTTKGDWSVWAYDTEQETLENIYYGRAIPRRERTLTHVDNIVVTPGGDIIVVEDGGNMEVNAIFPDGRIQTLARVLDQDDSEITGPAFSPDGQHFFFSSQRGKHKTRGTGGITYQISGNWYSPTKT